VIIRIYSTLKQVKYISLMKHINFDKYNDYNKVITQGIEKAFEVVSDIKLCIMARSM
jgi:hypothetical protein